MTPSDAADRAATRRGWMLRLWWLWLPLGIALIVYAVASGSDIAHRAVPRRGLIHGLAIVQGAVSSKSMLDNQPYVYR